MALEAKNELRRPSIRFGGFTLDLKQHRLLREATIGMAVHVEINITRSEYLLLRELAMHRGELVTRRRLMNAVWGTTHMEHGALETLVNALRYKLQAAGAEIISANDIIGYTLHPGDDETEETDDVDAADEIDEGQPQLRTGSGR